MKLVFFFFYQIRIPPITGSCSKFRQICLSDEHNGNASRSEIIRRESKSICQVECSEFSHHLSVERSENALRWLTWQLWLCGIVSQGWAAIPVRKSGPNPDIYQWPVPVLFSWNETGSTDMFEVALLEYTHHPPINRLHIKFRVSFFKWFEREFFFSV